MKLFSRGFLLTDPVRFVGAFDRRGTSIGEKRSFRSFVLSCSTGGRLPALVYGWILTVNVAEEPFESTFA